MIFVCPCLCRCLCLCLSLSLSLSLFLIAYFGQIYPYNSHRMPICEWSKSIFLACPFVIKYIPWNIKQFPFALFLFGNIIDLSLPEQNGCHFTDNIFKCILGKEEVFWFEFLWRLSLRVQLIIRQHWFRRQTHADPFHWLIYAALKGDELITSRSMWLIEPYITMTS